MKDKSDSCNILRQIISCLGAAILILITTSTGFAFHSGGVAECIGCHEMHGSAGPSLLQGTDASSTCLICHGEPNQSSYHILTPESQMPTGIAPLNMTPGGDFGWIKKNYYFTIRGSLNTELGHTHGHNVVAADESLVADPVNTTAPGGTFPGGQLSCASCHDMHGKGRWLTTGVYAKTGQAIYTSGSYGAAPTVLSHGSYATGVYRLLRGTGDTVDGVTFLVPPPVAVSPSTYNRSEFNTQTRTAYGSGMADWCSVCHIDMHNGGGNSSGYLTHPVDRNLSGLVIRNYNSYTKSGDMTGTASTSYLSLVPYEENLTYSAANITSLKSHAQTDDSYLNGPVATGNGSTKVFCLSCHRAHASGFMFMARWQNEGNFIIADGMYPGSDNAQSSLARGHSTQETSAAFYHRNVTKFSGYQRSLCNKCHAKD
jgi:predicted CXXCH cytochrome family protein